LSCKIRWLIDCGESVREETKKAKKRKKQSKATLSFAMDEEQDLSSASMPAGDTVDDDPPSKRAKFRKNPNVDTSFLPDREREEEERKERERLRQEWLKKQEDTKKEDIEVTYSYWDGSGHRKSVTVSLPLSCVKNHRSSW
jgi:protein FAM50